MVIPISTTPKVFAPGGHHETRELVRGWSSLRPCGSKYVRPLDDGWGEAVAFPRVLLARQLDSLAIQHSHRPPNSAKILPR